MNANSPHQNREANGQIFGAALVTVDTQVGDCVVTLVEPHPQLRRMHLHSLEEIVGAHQVQLSLSSTDPIAGDIAQALRFAGMQIKKHQEAKR